MQYNNIDALLRDFNADSCGKLYCLLEEANPGNNTRNNNQLKDAITGGEMRIERKGVDAFHVDDCRSFISCSQDVPLKIEQGDRRFVVNRTRGKFSPTGVKNGQRRRRRSSSNLVGNWTASRTTTRSRTSFSTWSCGSTYQPLTRRVSR